MGSAGEGSDQAKTEHAASAKGAGRAFAAAVVGVIVTGIVAGGILAGPHGLAVSPHGAEMATVAVSDLDAAQFTIAPASQGTLVAGARSCQAPLGVLSLSTTDSARSGYVRIHSGSYASPYFPVSNIPQRIALPFPAPYATGHGVIVVEGSATDVLLSLTPRLFDAHQVGLKQIPVWWPTDKPCMGD